jgi:hypothetical protein
VEKAKEKRSLIRKITRFAWKTVKYTIFTTLFLVISLLIAFQFPAFQTWVAHKASGWLSDKLNTRIEIEKVSIKFFSSINLKGVYVEDLHKDTLLYGGELDVQITDFSIRKEYLTIKNINFKNVNAKVLKYEKEENFNFQFLVDYFAPSDSTQKKDSTVFMLDYGRITLDNVNLTYADKNDTTRVKGMNYSDLKLAGLSGQVYDIDLKSDTILLTVEKLKAREKSGFNLKRLDAILKISPSEIRADSLWLQTDNTYLHGSLNFKQDSYDDFSDFTNKVNMKVQLNDSTEIGAADLAYFVPDLAGIHERVFISGKIRGTVNSLSASKIVLAYREKTEFRGDFNLTDVTIPDQFFLHFDVKKLSTNYADLAALKLPMLDPKEWKNALSGIQPLGLINYKGKIDGFMSDIAAKGTLQTSIGTLITDVGVSNIGAKDKLLAYHGNVRTASFNLGKLISVPSLETITANINLEGRGTSLKDLWAKVGGEISLLRYNNYNYERLSLKGEFKDKRFEGKFELKDPNADLDFYGSVNFNDKVPDMDFIATINKFELRKLHFMSSKDSVNSISSQVAILVKGDNANNMTGRINFDNTVYQVNNKQYKLSTFDLVLEQDQPVKTIKLNSGIADVVIAGNYNVTDLPNCFRQYLEKYFPTMIKEKKIPAGAKYTDNFHYKVKVKKFKTLSELFMPELRISPGTVLEGDFNATASELSLRGNSDSIRYKTYQIKNWYVNVNSLAASIDITLGMDRIFLNDSFYIGNFQLNTRSFDNNSNISITWDNASAKKNTGDLQGAVVFSNHDIDLQLNRAKLYISDSLWSLTDSMGHVTIDTSGMVNFRHLKFANSSQSISVDGMVSKNPDDAVELTVSNFRLGQINPLIQSAQLKMQGTVSGKARVSDIFNKVIFTSDFDFNNFYLNDRKLGNGLIKSIYDAGKEVVSLAGSFSKGLLNPVNGEKIKNIDFAGYYYPNKKENNVDIELKLKGLDITLLQPYLKDIITFSKGFVDGDAKVKGTFAKPEITGRMNLVSVNNMKVDYLNTYYSANGSIKIFPDRIQLGDEAPSNLKEPDPIHLYDREGHEATLWGNIFHNNFKITKLDFDINAKNFMVLNTSGANNPSYYGKAFVSGNVGIYGDLDYMNMDINLKTEKGTQFNIPLSGPATVSDNDYIIFVQADTSKKVESTYKNTLSGINLNFNLEATPDALVQLIFDTKSGDVIQAKGEGNISMKINTTGKFEMYGLYTLVDGNYLFSLENVVSKKFDIENGSTIKWTGDPLNADINITANYRQRAKLTPFFPSDSTGMYSKPTQASVMLYMKDKLLTPDITFGVKLPTVDETTRQTVLGYINNEQELNRQVFSLLILKSFVTPLQLSNSGVNVGAGAAASATSSEMLSNQLSNWLSQLSTNIDFQVNISPEQLELALSKQLFNDRLSIDGNVGVNNGAGGQKVSNMIGDIVVDYKVYPDGKLRVKGFNKSNDNTQITTQGGPFTQGVGIFYREEFNTINDLYKRYLGRLKKNKKPATP